MFAPDYGLYPVGGAGRAHLRSDDDMKHFIELVRGCLTEVREIMPWDLEERRAANP